MIEQLRYGNKRTNKIHLMYIRIIAGLGTESLAAQQVIIQVTGLSSNVVVWLAAAMTV